MRDSGFGMSDHEPANNPPTHINLLHKCVTIVRHRTWNTGPRGHGALVTLHYFLLFCSDLPYSLIPAFVLDQIWFAKTTCCLRMQHHHDYLAFWLWVRSGASSVRPFSTSAVFIGDGAFFLPIVFCIVYVAYLRARV